MQCVSIEDVEIIYEVDGDGKEYIAYIFYYKDGYDVVDFRTLSEYYEVVKMDFIAMSRGVLPYTTIKVNYNAENNTLEAIRHNYNI